MSGEVEIINFDNEREQVLGALRTGDIFGEVSALCDRPQDFTFRTRTLSQLLRLKQRTLREAMQTKQEDSVVIIRNFLKVTYMVISGLCITVIGSCTWKTVLSLMEN